jgi:hypothetical protein
VERYSRAVHKYLRALIRIPEDADEVLEQHLQVHVEDARGAVGALDDPDWQTRQAAEDLTAR